jgi:hypothetical protein
MSAVTVFALAMIDALIGLIALQTYLNLLVRLGGLTYTLAMTCAG